jgi:hypothetical protein
MLASSPAFARRDILVREPPQTSTVSAVTSPRQRLSVSLPSHRPSAAANPRTDTGFVT